MPTMREVALVSAVAKSHGYQFVMSELLPENPEKAVELLERHGHTVAVVEDGHQKESWLFRADVRIGLPGSLRLDDKVDIIMAHSDIRGIAHTIDLSRHAMQVGKQNLAVAAAATTINLGLAFVPAIAATTVSTLMTIALASNLEREMPINEEDAAEPNGNEMEPTPGERAEPS